MKQIYPINEIFYSLKGEGQWTGKPMIFIRLSGCNLTCSFCDTKHQTSTAMTTKEILERIKPFPAKKIVITGGEPMLYDLEELTMALMDNDYMLHLETNGTFPTGENFYWVACSPKSPVGTLYPATIQHADEIKFLVGGEGWKSYIDQVMNEFNPVGELFVMPLAESWKVEHAFHEGVRGPEGLIQSNMQLAIDYCLYHPEFSFCLQVHKVLRIL